MVQATLLAAVAFVSLAFSAAAQSGEPAPVIGREALEIGTSTNEIMIASDFRGAEITIFGAILGYDQNLLQQKRYNLVVALEGPKRNLTVRKKERVLGVWINTKSVDFSAVPSVYSLSTTDGVADLGLDSRAAQIGLGSDQLPLMSRYDAGGVGSTDEYQQAFLQLNKASGAFQTVAGGVEFLGSSLFKSRSLLPANTPPGVYVVRAQLYRDKNLIVSRTKPIRIRKAGFEQGIADAAVRQPLIYGLSAVLTALLTGWMASLLFRKD
ncbi:TIGR02186 family protein [Neorhizobium tomejilense]|uniref:TIGR02186 family protein n=1 Tax=Neorhizobium tomejilense TaxID=2093828 RepID=UPI003ED16E3A